MSGRPAFEWTRARLLEMRDRHLPSAKSISEALSLYARSNGLEKRPDRGSFRGQYRNLFGESPAERLATVRHEPAQGEKCKALVKFLRRAQRATLEEVCNALRVCPSDARSIADEAISSGYTISLDDSGGIRFSGLVPRAGESSITFSRPTRELSLGVCSDLHFGSRYHRGDELKDFAKSAYDAGVRVMLVAGDLLDGTAMYQGHEFDLSSHGFDAQARDLIGNLPSHDGMEWHFISGNHDNSFWKRSGQEPGTCLVDMANRLGRHDLSYHGSLDAIVRIGGDRPDEGLLVELYHPKKAGAYARSYHLQNYISTMSPGTKPQLLISGHEHSHITMYERNVWAIKPGTFQSQTPLMVALRLMPAIGGCIVRVSCTEDWQVRSISSQWMPYFCD